MFLSFLGNFDKKNMNDIKTREDIDKLIHTFYARVRKDERIGDFFNQVIVGEDSWAKHHVKLGDFWQGHLLGSSNFRGNPMEAHNRVDKQFDNSITSEHFGFWLNLWFDTIDSLFEGELAELAKNKARNMSTFLFMHIYQSREK